MSNTKLIQNNRNLVERVLDDVYRWTAQYQLSLVSQDILKLGVKTFNYGVLKSDENPYGRFEITSVNNEKNPELQEELRKLIFDAIDMDYFDWLCEEFDKEYTMPVKVLEGQQEYALERLQTFNRFLQDFTKI